MSSTANNDGGKGNSGFGTKDIIRKLERQIRSLEEGAGRLSVHGAPVYRIADSKELGLHILVIFGESGSEHASSLAYHRPIGIDYSFPKEGSWVVSQARDVHAFLSTAEHPGIKKIQANISSEKDVIAIALGLLERDPDGSLMYPGYKEYTRQQCINYAREQFVAYHEAKGQKPSDTGLRFEYFLDDKLAVAERKYLNGLHTSKEFIEKVKPLYKKLAGHRPHLLSMATQKWVPFLYGVEVGQLMQMIYNRMIGDDSIMNTPPDDYNIISVGIPVVKDTYVTDGPKMKMLVESLRAFQGALKARNVAASKKAGKSNSKEEKADLLKEYKDASANFESAKKSVRSSDYEFPSEAYEKNEIPIIKKSDFFFEGGPAKNAAQPSVPPSPNTNSGKAKKAGFAAVTAKPPPAGTPTTTSVVVPVAVE